jgi:hypothetical protein
LLFCQREPKPPWKDVQPLQEDTLLKDIIGVISFECCSSTMVSTLNSEFLRLPGGCLQSRDRKESRDRIEDSRKTSFRLPRSVAPTEGRLWAPSNRTSISIGARRIQILIRLYVGGQGFPDQPGCLQQRLWLELIEACFRRNSLNRPNSLALLDRLLLDASFGQTSERLG